MNTATVRLDRDDERLLDKLAESHGGRSNTIRQALRLLSAHVERQAALDGFLAEWNTESGVLDESIVSAMAERYGL